MAQSSEVKAEKARIRARAWHAANREYALERARKYAAKHREEARAKAAKWRLENCQRHRDNAMRYKAANPEKARLATEKWRRENYDRWLAHARNYKIRKRGAEGRYTGDDVIRLFGHQKGRCAACTKRLTKHHVDHIVPLSKGGSNYPTNLQLLCPPCNLSKKDKDPILFAQQRGRLL
jgi:5-methylcytosine-specific restriction endonuclease McrA